MNTRRIIQDAQIITLARVLEVLEEHPTDAKQRIKRLYDELREAQNDTAGL